MIDWGATRETGVLFGADPSRSVVVTIEYDALAMRWNWRAVPSLVSDRRSGWETKREDARKACASAARDLLATRAA